MVEQLTEDTRDMYGGTKADAAAKSATTSNGRASPYVLFDSMGP